MPPFLTTVLQFSWILSLAACLFFVARCVAISRALRKEYRIRIQRFDVRVLLYLCDQVGIKEIRWLLNSLIDATISLTAMVGLTVVLFSISCLGHHSSI